MGLIPRDVSFAVGEECWGTIWKTFLDVQEKIKGKSLEEIVDVIESLSEEEKKNFRKGL